MLSTIGAIPSGHGSRREASDAELQGWIAGHFKADVVGWQQISGGNRCRSWLVDLAGDGTPASVYLRYQPPRAPSAEPYTVWREAKIYLAIEATEVPAPRLLAVHDEHQAIVTSAAPGRADFRRLANDAARRAVTSGFIAALVALHAKPVSALPATGLSLPDTIADCVREELSIWTAMYEETGRRDPLITLALNWLVQNLPDPDEPPVLVHGDAGPGNFLFMDDRLTGLVDWELAHPGDPLEDLAWFSMRSVMEPVPDFAASLAEYEKTSGRLVDRARLFYHRVFVSTRVLIIRHRNVTGLPGNSIVSSALNRRLLVDALAAAKGLSISRPNPISAPPTPRTRLYDGLIDDMKTLAELDIPKARDIAKNSAKVLKYLREHDRIGAEANRRTAAVLSALLGQDLASVAQAEQALIAAIDAGTLDFARMLRAFVEIVGHEAQLAAPSSGAMALRGFPATEQTV